MRPTGTPAPIPLKGVTPTPKPSGSPSPSPSPSASPTTLPTLGPNQIAILGDQIIGSSAPGAPSDYIGNVHIFDADGTIVGDDAHYDGSHDVTVTGHAYIINRNADAILYADKIEYDSLTRVATLTNGRGETTEGVEYGKVHYTGKTMTMTPDGHVHVQNGSFTTCENARGGYHVESKSMDVLPNDKFIAHKNTLFLGLLGIFFLPLMLVPLHQGTTDQRRKPSFVPEVGYDDADGVYIRARIGFGTTDYYYGYYRLELYQKRGQGLGYVAYIGTKNNRRVINIDTYFLHGSGENSQGNQVNAAISDTENFTQRLRGQFNFTYTGDYGPLVDLPPSLQVGGSIVHQSSHSTENYQFQHAYTGSQSSTDNLAFIDEIAFGPRVTEGINLSYTDYSSAYPGQANTTSSTFHIESLTHYTTKSADYNFTFDKTDSDQPFGYDKAPELEIIPHLPFEDSRIPIETGITVGYYVEPANHFATERLDMNLVVGPALFKVFHSSDFSAGFTVEQDVYGTGDLKANVTQNLSLTTPIGNHIVNSITYDEQNPIGPTEVPFQLLDQLSGGSHQAQDTLRIFNKDIYSLSLSTGTLFLPEAQPILYQFVSRPSPRSALTISGTWNPGPGQGFYQTNVQLYTPFGREAQLQFATNINWKSHGQLADKTIFYRKIIGECYDIMASYNEDLKAFNLNFEILAFPGRTAGIGIAPNQPLLPTNFNY